MIVQEASSPGNRVRVILPFFWRVALGKAASGKPRRLKYLNVAPIVEQLRENEPLHSAGIAFATWDSEEERAFAKELHDLLESGGWLVLDVGHGSLAYDVDLPKDITIYLPDGGSPGLELLHLLLKRAGYKSTMVPGGGINKGDIQVGPATH